MRYAAFISYNHRDRKVAGWLHRSLETYRFPKRLRGRESAVGILGARLPPIFQDREELAASSDLAQSVREALEQAASLIVICSPNGAKSRWVNEEIRAFTAMGRRDRIQCLIVGGEPNASTIPGMDPALECLPPALFESGGGEPLASDIRPGQDGRTPAKLKLLAGITGLAYDELRQREQARRNRRLAIAAVVLGVALLVMTFLAVFALISRREAIAQRDVARRKTLTAERTVDFVKSMFAVADPSEAKGATITAREILDRGAARIDRELASEPSVRADLQTTLGEVYSNLGLIHQGDALIRRSMGAGGLDTGLRARQQLALGDVRSWQADDAGAVKAYGEALRLARDPKSDRADLVSRILAGLGMSEGYVGDAAGGERHIREALAADLRRGPDGEVDVARDLEALGLTLYGTNRLGEARSSFERALAIRLRRQGETHPKAMEDLNQVGSIAYLQHDPAAERYFRRALALDEKVLGPDHPETSAGLNNVGLMLVERRAYGEAIPLLRRSVAIQEAQRSAETSVLIFPLFNLALALRNTGHFDEAARLLAQDRSIAAKAKHRNLAPIMTEQADMACARGDRRGALAMIDQARPIMAKDYPKDPWRSAWLELVGAECRGDTARARRETQVVLSRWPASSHYGARAARAAR